MLIVVVVLIVTNVAALVVVAMLLLRRLDHPAPGPAVARVLDASTPPIEVSSSATRQIISIEILNAIELAGTRGKLAGLAGSIVPGITKRVVHDQAMKMVRRTLVQEQVVADVRLHTIRPPQRTSSRDAPRPSTRSSRTDDPPARDRTDAPTEAAASNDQPRAEPSSRDRSTRHDATRDRRGHSRSRSRSGRPRSSDRPDPATPDLRPPDEPETDATPADDSRPPEAPRPTSGEVRRDPQPGT